MTEKAGNVSEAVGFVSVNGGVVHSECTFETFIPDSIEFAEPFTNETIEGRVRTFLRTTLDDHLGQFDLRTE